MGVDIHILTEVKNTDGAWINCNPHFAPLDTDDLKYIGQEDPTFTVLNYPFSGRDTYLFDLLQTYLPVREIPKNISAITRDYIKKWDYSYGHTCVTYNELLNIWKYCETKNILTYNKSELYDSFSYFMKGITQLYQYTLRERSDSYKVLNKPDNFRLLFFFDR